jgi:histidyl-tRNA synthetase
MSKAKQLQPVRGTHDLLPEDCRLHRHIEEAMIRVAKRFGFAEMATPIFEFTEVFKRTLGETSDVVNKEMYTFDDRGGTSITLRPEGTAAVARAFISNGLAQQVPFKVVYRGPMFRYERPQKGRQRQFHQFGAELIGVEKPQADIEVLAMASQIMAALGLQERVTLELNTLGDAESRANYRAALVAYFSAYKDKLSEDSRTRLENNPMRILDSKDAGDREIVANAPRLKDHLNAYSADFFQQVCAGLDALGIAYTLNDRLVRGLDYYCHTAFEFTTTELGAQSAVLSGGRYDNLIENMGGAKTAGIGWAAGLERLVLMLDQQRPQPAGTCAAASWIGRRSSIQREYGQAHEARG